jgi:hypothetical protein
MVIIDIVTPKELARLYEKKNFIVKYLLIIKSMLSTTIFI